MVMTDDTTGSVLTVANIDQVNLPPLHGYYAPGCGQATMVSPLVVFIILQIMPAGCTWTSCMPASKMLTRCNVMPPPQFTFAYYIVVPQGNV
jgi:hypothetical protein